MKYEVKPATAASLDYIIRHLSQRNRREIDAMNLSRFDALTKAIDWMTGGNCEGVLHIEGKPACTVGFDGDFTWFLATEAFFDAGMRPVVMGRKFLKEAAKKREILTISYSDHPDAERWFEVLGFEKIEKSWFSTIYRFPSTSTTQAAISDAA